MNLVRTVFRRIPGFGRAKAISYRLLLTKRKMMFPSFSETLHNELASEQDYFRYATMLLALQTLERQGISGAIAEVGVYQGHTSRYLRKAAPDRMLYLFDTFEGFPADQLESFQKGDFRFRDTHTDLVKRSIGSIDNVVIRKGVVPSTLSGLENERFAFVLLDLDLFEPTLRSLEFFYPRVQRGGYIFIHDYNNPESDWACKRAFDLYLADKIERPMEIGDLWGTALIRKL